MEENYMNGRPNGVNGHAQMLHLIAEFGSDAVSRSTSPGLGWERNDENIEKRKRYRPRTFPYFKLLPYGVEEEAERNAALKEILKQLYIAIKAEDFSPGAVHWTRELKLWLNLKFEITRGLRVKLVKLYYMLALAPGLDPNAAERFAMMFMVLTK
jgi:proteasome activator subunit 4